ncbi:MAG: ATP-binding protein [Calditrichaeota bacterium]|nr:MAG: ATP-binding protein [Calditrichota bacterium]
MQQLFPRSIQSLDSIFELVDQFRIQYDLDQKTAYEIELAIEEVFTNLVKYNDGTSQISLQIEIINTRLTIVLQDFDVDDFDITRPPPVDPQARLEERRVGGLGLFLVHKVMDQVEYQYQNRVSTITMIKKIGEDLCSK